MLAYIDSVIKAGGDDITENEVFTIFTCWVDGIPFDMSQLVHADLFHRFTPEDKKVLSERVELKCREVGFSSLEKHVSAVLDMYEIHV